MNVLAVCDTGPDFGRRLAQYARNRAGYPFVLQSFSTPEQLLEYRRKRPPEAVLLAEELYQEKDWRDFANPLFLLGSGFGKEEGPKHIFRYQEADGILREILLLYREQRPEIPVKVVKGSFCLYVVTDAAESCRSEAFAFELAMRLSEKQRVLWLDLRTWPTLAEMYGCSEDTDLGELLYALCRRKKDLPEQMMAEVSSFRGVDLLPAAKNPADFLSVTPEDWKYLFDLLKRESIYTAVVVAVGNVIQPLRDFMELFDTVWMVWEETQMVCQERMEKYIKNVDCPQLWQKIVGIQLPPVCRDPETDRQMLCRLAVRALQEGSNYGSGEKNTSQNKASGTPGICFDGQR